MAPTKSIILLSLLLAIQLGIASASIQATRKLLQSEEQGDGGFRASLIHPASPSLAPYNSTLTERLKKLVEKSNARANWIASRYGTQRSSLVASRSSSGGGIPAQEDYESPLTPDGGSYLMEISVGTPAQSFKAIADTGSDLVWVQADPCSGCSGSVFHPRSSSTYKAVSCTSSMCHDLPEFSCSSANSCEYQYQYASGKTSGVLAQDTVSLQTTSGSSHDFAKVAISCGLDNEGFHGAEGLVSLQITSGSSHGFPEVAIGCGLETKGFDGFEGLVGLGQGPISLTSQLSTAISQKFSYCLVGINSATASSPLLFGSAAALTGSGIQSTPIVASDEYPTYYVVTVQSLTVAGRQMGNPGTTIFDSGTTFTYVPDSVYSNITSTFRSLITLPKADGSSVGLDLCYDTSRNKSYKFPSLVLTLAGATMSPPSANYFLAIDEAGDTTCLAMGSTNGVSIVGNVMQQGYHILYDRGASTISFQTADCASLK